MSNTEEGAVVLGTATELEASLGASSEDVVAKLKAIANVTVADFYDKETGRVLHIHELSKEAQSSIESYDVREVVVGEVVMFVPIFKFIDRVKVLTLLGKHTGAFEAHNHQKKALTLNTDVKVSWE